MKLIRGTSPFSKYSWYLFICFLFISAALFGKYRTVLCQSPEIIEESKVHFNRGISFFRKGRYFEALEEFWKSYSIRPHWGLLYNIGICYYNMGREGRALTYLLKFIEEGAEIPEERASRVLDFIDELTKKVGMLRFSGTTKEMHIYIDGEYCPDATTNRYVFLRPGKRLLRILVEGKIIYEGKVVIKRGQEEFLTVNLPEQGASGVGERTAKVEPVAAEKESVVKKQRRAKKLLPFSIGFGILAGLSVVGYVAAGIVAINERDKMEDVERQWESVRGGASETIYAEYQNKRDMHYHRATKARLWANIFFGAAVVFSAIEVVFVVLRWTEKKKNASKGRKVFAGLSVARGTGRMELMLNF